MNVSDTFQNMSRACVVSCRWSQKEQASNSMKTLKNPMAMTLKKCSKTTNNNWFLEYG